MASPSWTSKTTLTADKIVFENNTTNSKYGGAIFNQNYLGTSKLAVGNDASFLNNTAPITNSKCVKMGTIIKFDENEISNQNNNNNISTNNNLRNESNDISNNNLQNEFISIEYNDIVLKKESNNITKNKEDEEYCLDYHTDNPSIRANFTSCPIIGLQNIGATCYMNATLQCFCHIEKFIEFFKFNPQIINIVKKDKKKLSLSSSFKLLIEKLWPNNYNNKNSLQNKDKYYAPEEFKAKFQN